MPEPVGATTRAFRPAAMLLQAPRCAPVGSANTSRNHVDVAGVKPSSGSAGARVAVTSTILPAGLRQFCVACAARRAPLGPAVPVDAGYGGRPPDGPEPSATRGAMKETELWARLERHLGAGYYRVWAAEQNLADLGGRTVVQALEAGVPTKEVWRAAWAALELPARER